MPELSLERIVTVVTALTPFVHFHKGFHHLENSSPYRLELYFLPELRVLATLVGLRFERFTNKVQDELITRIADELDLEYTLVTPLSILNTRTREEIIVDEPTISVSTVLQILGLLSTHYNETIGQVSLSANDTLSYTGELE